MTFSLDSYFSRDVVEVARDLIGAEFLYSGCGGIIVETEAYHPGEAASHAHRGETPRNGAMFLGPAHVYVYRSYGIHWCFNLVCADASAVLIRAIAPTAGIAEMRARRGLDDLRTLCSGPGKLCAAMGITGEIDRRHLSHPDFKFTPAETRPDLLTGRRIGITKAADLPWRFGLAGSPHLSRSFGRAAIQ